MAVCVFRGEICRYWCQFVNILEHILNLDSVIITFLLLIEIRNLQSLISGVSGFYKKQSFTYYNLVVCFSYIYI